ncbi:MAG: mechanosensitive ion channel family protein, partial [Ruminococcus sp.]|nr:mechanosensitive ion channel family protein [Ruminococcus sp.]
LGIGGVAVAFACKDIVENMLSGFIIIFDKPFEVGDFIELNGDKGSVIDIKIRTTRLMGIDGCEKVYPNTAMANSSVTNWTKMSKRAVSQTIAVTYSTSSDKLAYICDGIKGVLLQNANVLKDDIRVNFTDFGNHALEISLFFYVDKVETPDYLVVKNNINLDLKQYFEQNNVDLAFESKTLYFGDELKIQK